MPITPSSLAAGNQVGIKNEQFAVGAQVIEQINCIIATVDPSKEASLNMNQPKEVFSAEQVGALTGFGFMMHRLAKALFAGGKSKTYIIPQSETGNQSTGSLALSGTATEAGEVAFYIANERNPVSVAIGDTAAVVATALKAVLDKDDSLPVTYVDNGSGTLTFTSKSAGLNWGDFITLALNLNSEESLPAGITAVITDMSGGTGTPDIQDALDSMGTGDAQNELKVTQISHGYGAVTAVLDALSTWNGAGNDYVGNYQKTVGRPVTSLIGDTYPGLEYGLGDLITFANGRKNDRTNGIFPAPGEYYHPQELAARVTGIMGVANSLRAESSPVDRLLLPSYAAVADRWTNDYDNRDLAVKSGVGISLVKNGYITLQNLVTFYRPDSVAPSSNGYRSIRNIKITQNILANKKANYERDKWKDIVIVEDTANVTAAASKAKARDVGTVIDDELALADVFAGLGWLYTASYSKANVSVALRDGLTGFDIDTPYIYSGEGGILNQNVTFDTSIAVLQTGGN